MILTKTFAVGQRCIELRVYAGMMKCPDIALYTSIARNEMNIASAIRIEESSMTLSSNRAGLHYAAFIPNSPEQVSALTKAGWNKCKRN